MHDWNNKRVTVVGLGRTGQAFARYVHAKGARVFISEAEDTLSLREAAEGMRNAGIEVELGGHSARALEAEVVVLSPGVPATNVVASEAREQSRAVLSEIEAVWADCPAPIYAVTGTNGKTTTTMLLHHIFEAAGMLTVLCGNNDLPLSEALRTEPLADAYVLEVSSYQLENAFTFRPRAAAVLNVTPDHARHGSLREYSAVKNRIFRCQGEGDVSVVNVDDPLVWEMELPGASRVATFSAAGAEAHARVEQGQLWCGHVPICAIDDIPLRGSHNIANVLAAILLADAARLNAAAIARGIRTFKGVPHRIEFVAAIDGVPYFNDSKSTNVDSLRVALESFGQPVVLIAGGRGKGAQYGPLEPLIRKHVRGLVLIGEDGPKMAAAWGHVAPSVTAANMAEAVHRAADSAEPGDIVLLSPGCASFDWYQNFEERGEDFRRCVKALAANSLYSEDAPNGA